MRLPTIATQELDTKTRKRAVFKQAENTELVLTSEGQGTQLLFIMAQENLSSNKFQPPVESGNEHAGTFESGKLNETLKVSENPPLRENRGSDHTDEQFSPSDEQAVSETSHKPREEFSFEGNHDSDLVDMNADVGLFSEQETEVEPNETLDPGQNQDGDVTDTHGILDNGEELDRDQYEQVNGCVHQETMLEKRAHAVYVYVRFSDQLTVKPHMLPRHSRFVASRPTVDQKRRS